MKPSDRKRLMKAIQGELPNLQEKGRMLLVVPRGSILKGFYLEDSSNPNAAYIWAFIQPLFIASTTVVFNLGRRLGGSCHTWKPEDLTEVAKIAVQDGWPFLQQVCSSDDLADWPLLAEKGEYLMQVRAYALGASGRWAEAVPVLRALASSLAGTNTGWRQDLKEQAECLAILATSAPDEAARLLALWEQETVKNLGLNAVP